MCYCSTFSAPVIVICVNSFIRSETLEEIRVAKGCGPHQGRLWQSRHPGDGLTHSPLSTRPQRHKCTCAKSIQSCPTLCDPIDWSPPGSSVHRILQARIVEWVAHFLLQGIFLTQGLNPRLTSPALAGRFFTTSAAWKAPQRRGCKHNFFSS